MNEEIKCQLCDKTVPNEPMKWTAVHTECLAQLKVENRRLIKQYTDAVENWKDDMAVIVDLKKAIQEAIKDLTSEFIIDGAAFTHDAHALEVLRTAIEKGGKA